MWEAESSAYWKERSKPNYKSYIILACVALLLLCGFLLRPTAKPQLDEETIRQIKEVAIQKAQMNCHSTCYSEGDSKLCDPICADYVSQLPR